MSVQELITDHLDLWTGAVTHKRSAGRGLSGKSGKVELTGIKKLRELILELAVRGKLVEQDPTDEPASVLLEKIAEEKARLVKEGKIKKSKKLPGIDEEEVITELPTIWSWARLGEITNYGVTDKAEPGEVEDTSWVLELEDIEKESSRLIQRVTYKERPFKSSKNRFQQDDVLYGKLRPYLDKVLVADRPGVCTTEIIPVRGFSGITSSYLRLSLKSPAFKIYANDSTHGMNLPRLGTDKARLALIPVPPTEEQNRIVEKVDELLTLCDRLEQQIGDQLEAHEVLVDTLLDALTRSVDAAEVAENWARLAENFDTLFTTEASIDKLKQAILQLAVMGKLVEQDPTDEPASALLEKIADEKARLVKEGKIKKSKKPWEVAKDRLTQLPETWRWVALGELVSIMDAGWSPACPPEPAGESEWGVLKTTSVQVMSYFQQENKRLPEGKKPKRQYEVNSGDILITRAGPKNRVGISCWVDKTRPRLMISDKIIRFHLIDAAMSEPFICLCLNAGLTSQCLENAKSGMAESQMNISQDKLKAAPIPLCPANEQHRIVAKVDELMALCDRLKARLAEAGKTCTRLAEAVVEKGIH